MMRFSEFMRKLNPIKSSFHKVTTTGEEAVPIELEEAYKFAFSPKPSIQLRLIDSSDSDEHPPKVVNSFSAKGSKKKKRPETVNSVSGGEESPSSVKSMKIGFRRGVSNGSEPPEDDLNLEVISQPIYRPTTTCNEIDDHHPETQLLSPDPSPNLYFERGDGRRRCKWGVRLWLILAMVAFIVTICLAVAGVFIVDSLKIEGVGNGTINGNETLTSRHVYNLFGGILPDVNDEDEEGTENGAKSKGIFIMGWNYTTTDPTIDTSLHTPEKVHKKTISQQLIRESYNNALNQFANDSPSSGTTDLWNYNRSNPLEHEQIKKLFLQQGQVMELAYRNIVKTLNLSVEEANMGEILLDNANLPKGLCPTFLDEIKECNRSEAYRSLDGTCNHFNKPFWGSANQPYRRILFPKYSDGISSPRGSIKNLPSARLVSDKVHIDEFRMNTKLSMIVPLWAHFIYHDIAYTSEAIPSSECCNKGGNSNSECFPIRVATSDPFYSERNLTCLEYERDPPHGSCRFGPREQFNKATAFIDGSHIYGVTEKITKSLRSTDPKKRGEMILVSTDSVVDILPNSTCSKHNTTDETFREESLCFISGDERVNNVLTITALQIIWVRHHNTVANRFSELNLHWNDEKVFQEARRFIIAQIQHITFNEFLPRLFSKETLSKEGLTLTSNGYYQEFDSSKNPGISNGFSIAFKFFQSMIQGLQKKLNPRRDTEQYIQFHKLTSGPAILLKDGELDKFILGSTSQHCTQVDSFISGQITNHMYQHPNKTYGLDLISMIIQEGRDHGVPPYIDWRKKCLLSEINSFNDLTDIWDSSAIQRAKDVFLSVGDVDLFVGMLSELPNPKSELGPTLSCIIADQFERLRKGDMFWYEGDIRSQFTSDQLKTIRKTTLSKIICESCEHIRHIQKNVMIVPNNNDILRCDQLPKVKLNSWKEGKPKHHYHYQKHGGEEVDDGIVSIEEYDANTGNSTTALLPEPTKESVSKAKGIEILTNPPNSTNKRDKRGGGSGRKEKNKS